METTSGFVNVHWNERHMSATMQSRIAQMYDRKTLVDVTLACEDYKVECHRLVLSACSPFFADIISRNSSPDLVICLVGIQKWQIEALISFMYRGVIEAVTLDQLDELMKVAKDLQVCGFYNCHVANTIHESTMSGNSNAGTFPFIQKKRQQSTTPILIDLADVDSSEGSNSETDPDCSERNDIVDACDDQEGLPARLPMTKPLKKRPVAINVGEEVDKIQSSGNEAVVPDARVEVEGAETETRTIQNETGVGNSPKKIKLDPKGTCDSSNGSALDANLLLGLGLQSGLRAEDTVKTTQVHIETKVKQVRRSTRRGKKLRISSLLSRPDIAAYPGQSPEQSTVVRSEEIQPQNHHQQSVHQDVSVNRPQVPALDIAEFEQIWTTRLLSATFLILYGSSIDQASAYTGIPVPYLTEYLRRHGGTNVHQSQQTEQEGVSNPPATDYGESPTSSYPERELQESARQIHEQMLLACWNMSILPGQSSSNSKVPTEK